MLTPRPEVCLCRQVHDNELRLSANSRREFRTSQCGSIAVGVQPVTPSQAHRAAAAATAADRIRSVLAGCGRAQQPERQ